MRILRCGELERVRQSRGSQPGEIPPPMGHMAILETFLIVTARGEVLSACSRERPGVLLNSRQCTEPAPSPPQQRIFQAQKSIVLRLRNWSKPRKDLCILGDPSPQILSEDVPCLSRGRGVNGQTLSALTVRYLREQLLTKRLVQEEMVVLFVCCCKCWAQSSCSGNRC